MREVVDSSPKAVELIPFSRWRLLPIAFAINKLVQQNPDLQTDFPGVGRRYSTFFEAVKSVRRARKNKAIAAFLVRTNTTVYEQEQRPQPTALSVRDLLAPVLSKKRAIPFPHPRLRAQGEGADITEFSFSRRHRPVGVATIADARIDGVAAPNVALWLDKSVRSQGIGSLTLTSLVDKASRLRADVPRVTTVVRPENTASIAMVEAVGFQAVGTSPRDFTPEMGDGVSAPRQLYEYTA